MTTTTPTGWTPQPDGLKSPEQIASEITNPVIGISPDFSNAQRPVVLSAIELGIEIDRAQHAGIEGPPPLSEQTIRKLVAQRSGL